MQEWGDCVVDGVPTLKCLEVVFNNIIFLSNALIIVALLVMFVIGSVKYLTSLGNQEKVAQAQGTFKWALIGLLLYVAAYLILNVIDLLFLGGNKTIFHFSISGP